MRTTGDTTNKLLCRRRTTTGYSRMSALTPALDMFCSESQFNSQQTKRKPDATGAMRRTWEK
jgi:hypothetical protein